MLNVSAQAVSRWETNMSYPDIELLPEIAGLFGITIDELLCTDSLLKNEKIELLIEKANSYYKEGDIQKGIDLLEDSLKENPTNVKIIEALIFALSVYTYCDNRKNVCQRIIDLSSKIIEKAEQKHSLYQVMAYTYLELGDIENAKKCALKLPKMECSSNLILSSILDGNEKVKLLQENITSLFNMLIEQMNKLLKTDNYSEEEKIILLEKSNSLIEVMYENLTDEYFLLERNNMMLARLYAKRSDKKNTCLYLFRALESAKNFDNCSSKKNESLLKNKIDINFGKSYSQSEVELLLNNLQDEVFDFVRSEDDFKKIISEFSN